MAQAVVLLLLSHLTPCMTPTYPGETSIQGHLQKLRDTPAASRDQSDREGKFVIRDSSQVLACTSNNNDSRCIPLPRACEQRYE